MSDEPLIDAAGRIADGQSVDWQSLTSSLSSDEERELVDELEQVARIAASHRSLHQLLPASSDAPTEPALDRARWGHLELLDVVGRGSFGSVYRAWDTRLERLVALKLFPGAANPATVMQEGRMLARVRHEHVVTVYGADVIDGVAGIWMELVHGSTLDRIIKHDGPMPPRAAAAVGRDVARALSAIHDAKLLHCDVKAQNVVRETTGRVVLMDMGAGRLMPEMSDDQISDVTGTPRYMAPELFEPGATATKASDVYSLGVLLYYLASGRFPVDGKSVAQIRQAHRDGRITPLSQAQPDLSPAYIALVDQILDPDPARRPVSADAVQKALAPLATPPVARPSHVWKWMAAALGVVLAALVVWREAGPAPIRSIAVLPIRNLTGDPDKTYVADGLTTVLISNLAHIASLRVPSFEAVAPLRGRDDSPADAARKLGVQLLLAGSITQADTRFRMSVQLIDPATGAAIWGEEITREPPGMMSAQADIARFVAERLGLDLSRTERRALQPQALSPQVQDIYLRALALRTTLPAARRESARLFRQATELEPTFAAAWAELALVEVALIAESPTAERMARSALVRQMADRAIQLDPSLAAGYAALGTIQFYDNWDFASAEKTFQQALSVDPSAGFPRQRLSMLLAARGRLDEAVRVAQDAVRLEPLVPGRAITLGGIHYYARDYDRAESEARRALQLSPDFPTAYFLLGQIAAARGQYDDAIGYVRRALGGSNYMGWLADLARICAAAGRRDEVQKILAELDLRQQAGESYSPDNLAYIAVAEGRFDEAFRVLDDAVNHHLVNVLWIAVDPRVDPLRRDPRFARLLAKTGLQ